MPAELVQAGEEAMIDILTTICNKIWTQSLIITRPKMQLGLPRVPFVNSCQFMYLFPFWFLGQVMGFDCIIS